MQLTYILIAVSYIALALGTYAFGLMCGRAQEQKRIKPYLEKQRDNLMMQRHSAYIAGKEAAEAIANHSQKLLNTEDYYTLTRAAHELQLAAKTFEAMNSQHALTAANLSAGTLSIAQRMAPKTAANAAAINQQENAA
ncbi:MAG: hypothetical protein CVV07_07255 [Gammaproteobacteria bacterium HGW-Gammaproteobacteria-11]|nr:MAG: hypothetical protein CVV07_07255 [Gammaproteobacteria bacterium HGW-Gammaproteobacteria-11]